MPPESEVFLARGVVIYNVTMTSANTEYSQALPAGTKKVLIKERSGTALVKLAYKAGLSGTTYITLPNGSSKWLEGIIFSAARTLYFQSTSAGKVLEIEAWQ